MTQAQEQISEQIRETPPETIDLRHEFADLGIGSVLDQLDSELIGLKPVKTRIREIASLLLVERIRQKMALATTFPDPAHVVHRQSRHRQDHGCAQDGRHPAQARLRPPRPRHQRHA